MKYKVTQIDQYSFKFEDIDIVYPIHVKSNRTGNYYNIIPIIYKSDHSRTYQLDHRSTQSFLFDKLLELNHFKLLGIDHSFIPEFPIINTGSLSKSSYYLLDYFIPELSIAIELDSSLHECNGRSLEDDKLRDNFLKSVGIEVYRIKDFNINTKEKLDSLVQFLKSQPINKFSVDYSSLIEEYKEYKNGLKPNKNLIDLNSAYSLDGEVVTVRSISNSFRKIGITPKRAEKIAKICTLDMNIYRSIVNGCQYSVSIELDKIYKVLPMDRKESGKYASIINYLNSLGIYLKVFYDAHKN